MGSSIHIQKSVSGSVGHNSREHFTYSVVFTDEPNECTTSQAEAYKIYRSELKERSKKYTERTGQRLQKNTVTQLSAVVNLESHHTLKDLEPLKAELEKKFDTKVYQMAIHRDEGKLVSKADGTELYSGKDFFLNTKDNELYFDKKFTKKIDMNEYEVVKNYHAHIEMMGLDSDGKAIRQKMNKVALKQLQTFTADTLKMERGKETKSYTKEQMSEILAKVGKKSDYESTTLYAKRFNEVAKELGYYHEKRKRKDTHQFKDYGAERENAKRAELAKVKDLKEQMKELRAELQENGAVREDYAKLEQLNKELKEQIKAKDLTIEELQAKVKEYRDIKIKELETKVTELEQDKISDKKLINGLESKNSTLSEELVEKQKEIDSRTNESEIQTYIEEELEVKLKKNGKPKQFGLKSLIAYLVNKVKDFKEKIAELTAENEVLKAENKQLQEQIQEHVDNTNLDDLLKDLHETKSKLGEDYQVNDVPEEDEEHEIHAPKTRKLRN